MPTAELILTVLIGTIFGAIASVALRGRGSLFFVNVMLGVMGSALGAFFPVLIGQSLLVDVGNFSYLLRGLFGAFLLIILASLFRSAKPPGAL